MRPREPIRSPPGTVPSGALNPAGGRGSGALGERAVDVGFGAGSASRGEAGISDVAGVAYATPAGELAREPAGELAREPAGEPAGEPATKQRPTMITNAIIDLIPPP